MDLNALRKRFAELDAKNKRGSKSIWKPEGKHNARVLELPDNGTDDIGKELFFHFDIGKNRKVYCPKNDGNDCPVCDFADLMKEWNDVDGKPKEESKRKADFEIFRKLQAGSKHFVPVIVRKSDTGDDYDGPFWWECSPGVCKDLIKICLDEDYNATHPDGGGLGILTSIEHGRDVTVQFMKPGDPGNQTSFNKVSVSERKVTRPLLNDRKQAAQLASKLPDLAEAVKVLSTAEVQKMFDEAFGADGAQATAGTSEIEHGAEAPANNAEKLTGTKTVDEAMDKLKSLIKEQGK